MPNQLQLDALSLGTVRTAITSQLNPANIEVSLCGDLRTSKMQELVLTYLGTVPSKTTASTAATAEGTAQSHQDASTSDVIATLSEVSTALPVHTLGTTSQLGIYFPDSEERAMGYLAGPAPNQWGRLSDGSTLFDKFIRMRETRSKRSSVDSEQEGLWSAASAERWKDPVFAHTALLILQEVSSKISLVTSFEWF